MEAVEVGKGGKTTTAVPMPFQCPEQAAGGKSSLLSILALAVDDSTGLSSLECSTEKSLPDRTLLDTHLDISASHQLLVWMSKLYSLGAS